VRVAVPHGPAPRIDVRRDEAAHRARGLAVAAVAPVAAAGAASAAGSVRALALAAPLTRPAFGTAALAGVAVGLREARVVDVPLEGAALSVVRAARVRGGPGRRVCELFLDAGAGRSVHGPLEEQALLELGREADDDVYGNHRPDLGRGLDGDLFAGLAAGEPDHHRRERGLDDGVGVGHPLRVRKDEHAAMLLVWYDDRLDGTQSGTRLTIHIPRV